MSEARAEMSSIFAGADDLISAATSPGQVPPIIAPSNRVPGEWRWQRAHAVSHAGG